MQICGKALLRKDINNGNVLGFFRYITLLNIEFKILLKGLAKTLVLVVNNLIVEVQTNRFIDNYLHLMRHIIYRDRTKAGFGSALIKLDQLKAFDKDNHRYLEAVLKAGSFGPVFRG